MRSRWRIVWAMMKWFGIGLLVLGLYVGSIGPVVCLVSYEYVPESVAGVVRTFYHRPLIALINGEPQNNLATLLIATYIGWWENIFIRMRGSGW